MRVGDSDRIMSPCLSLFLLLCFTHCLGICICMNVRNVVEKLKDFQKSKLNRHTQSGGGVGAKTAKSAQETVSRIPDQT